MRPRLALLAPAALALAACGGSGGGHATTTTAASADPVATAVAATQQAGSEDTTLSATVTLGKHQTFVLNGKGAFDQKASAGRLAGTLALGKNGGTTPVQELFKGTTVYLRSPLVAALAGGGKPWVAVDLAKSGTVAGFDVKALTGESPADVLTQLGGVTKTKTVGKEQVDGVDTTHYSATAGTGPIDVWVDGKNLIRKVHLDYTTQATKSSAAHIVLDMTLSNFGVKVDAPPPPASQVGTLSS